MIRLIWKEWREQSWKLAFGCIVLCTFALIGLKTRVVADESIMIGTCAMGVLLLPILAAAGLIPAERGEGTLRTLLAMPVEPWKVLTAKTLLGVTLCVGPMAAAAIVSVLMTRGREITEGDVIAFYLRSTATALVLFMWMLSLSARSPTEGRAAALSVGIMVIWLLVLSALKTEETVSRVDARTIPLRVKLYWPACPFFFVFGPKAVSLLDAIGTEIVVVSLLWLRAARVLAVSGAEARE